MMTQAKQSLRDSRVMSEPEMYNRIADEIRVANTRYDVIVLDTFPRLRSINEAVIMGNFSWTLTHSRQRLIQAKNARYVKGEPCTPSDLARRYLDVKFPDVLRCRTSQYQAYQVHRSHPLYARPCLLEQGVYVDIASAYWSILKAIGWNCEYKPVHGGNTGFLGVGDSMRDFPFAGDKIARNCLVSLGIGRGMRMYSDGKFTVKKIGNVHRNLGLWCCVQDILNSVAYEMVALADARYVHTDGYLLPFEQLDTAMSILEAWGLPSRIKRIGRAKVYGTGSYAIGGYSTKRPLYNPVEMRSIRPAEDVDWLKAQFSVHAKRVLKQPDNAPTLSTDDITRWLFNQELDDNE
jgi:hypothetical protein